jgi:magnesium chelatase subunit D
MTVSEAPLSGVDAALAACLFAVDAPATGIVVRSAAGPVRDRWLCDLTGLLPEAVRLRRLPLQISDDRLLGGIDLAATLRSGRPVAQRGLLAETHGGVLVVAMAERLSPGIAARLAHSQDLRTVAAERGAACALPAAIGWIAFDEGASSDERPPACLSDRLAIHIDLNRVSLGDLGQPTYGRSAIEAAALALGDVEADDEALVALCAGAGRLGILSLRPPLFALRVAKIAAALDGRRRVTAEDLGIAARLVLAPRARRDPNQASEPSEDETPPEQETRQDDETKSEQETEPDAPDPAADQPAQSPEGDLDDAPATPSDFADVVIEAAASVLPEGLLSRMPGEVGLQVRSGDTGRSGAAIRSNQRGRPIGTRRGEPREGRLNLVETLRAAAPWQPMRRREAEAGARPLADLRVLVRRTDFRITRYQQRTQTTTIFAVDASGSSALHRLSEAKGAVELLLKDCYVRRDQVALIAFRGDKADVVLPPTRSLVRAKRSLAAMPAGGGTPLALGLEAVTTLAALLRGRGQTPVVVLLTDGRANIARDGTPGRAQAMNDALAAARGLGEVGCTAVVIDTSPRPQAQAEGIAKAMAAHYVPLPYADAQKLSQAARLVALPRGAPTGRR